MRKIVMHLDREEFAVTYDPRKATPERLIATVKASGYTAQIVTSKFTAAWCAPCQRMEKPTFADAKVRELLERCVLVKIDTDHHPELAERMGVVGLPDLRFVTPEGTVIHQLKGFQSAESFAAALARFLQTM